MNKLTTNRKTRIGRAEKLDFIRLGIFDIPAKVDSGAYRSAVHASNIKLINHGKTLRFNLLGQHAVFGKMAQTIETDNFKIVKIENSFGHTEERYEVRLKITMAGQEFTTSFSLANRQKKIYPVLLGRKLLNNRFIIDTSKTSVDRSKLKKAYEIEFPKDDKLEEES